MVTCSSSLGRLVVEAVVCLPKAESDALLRFVQERKVGHGAGDEWFVTALNLAAICRFDYIHVQEN